MINETNLFPLKFTREMLRADELKVLAPKEKMMEVSKRWKEMSKEVKDRYRVPNIEENTL
jgi:hypothetical protein